MEQLVNFKKYKHKFFWIIVLFCSLFGLTQILSYTVNPDSSDLIINEFSAANNTSLADEDGDIVDWIEIYNRGNSSINLAGWALTDDPNQPQKWSFPDMSLGSQEYLVVFASGKNRHNTEPDTNLHTNFRLNQEGEFLGLHNIHEDEFIDIISPHFSKQFQDMSYGRYGNEQTYGYLVPTPGEVNNEAVVGQGIVSMVEFGLKRGFYDTPFLLELTTPTAGAVIHYTIDGSEPTETNGTIYNGPILVENTTVVRAVAFRRGFLPSPINAHTFIFLDGILAQPSVPVDFPSTWGIHRENFKDYRQGEPVVADYEMDPEIINNPRYKDLLKDGFKSIPSMSITMDMQNFEDLYSNPRDRGKDWERSVSTELIYPDGDQPGFHINAGIRIHGGVGRREFIPKHSFRLFFRNEYGAAKLIYPLFPDSSVEEFDTLVLRSGSDRSYAGTGPVKDRTTYTRDEWIRASQLDMSGSGSHGIFVHLYVNGLYWGLYNLIERPDDAFMVNYFGGQKEEWFVANQDGPLDRNLDDTADAINRLFITIGFTDRSDLDVEQRQEFQTEQLPLVKPYINTPHFFDYIILNWYAGTKDWPENNWYTSIRNPDGQFRPFVWDGQEIWDGGANIRLGKTASGRLNVIKPVFEILMQDPDLRVEFADRMYKQLFNDGALSDANAQARWLIINDTISQAIVGESARWGDVRNDSPITPEDWLRARDEVMAQMDGNAAKLIVLAREQGYYPPIDPPEFNQYGGLVTEGFELTIADPSGTIYYTIDGTDPRIEVTGTISPDALTYQNPIILTTTTHIKARLLFSDTWSALSEATFSIVEIDPKVRFTEIMYNPLDGGDYEFIELQNTGDTPFDLANLFFDEGIRYTFSTDTVPIAPNEFVVLVHNPVAFAERYPNVEIGGVYTGQLSNKGEKISLKDVAGNVILLIEYDDENGWPISPDGRGDSLTLIDPNKDPNNPQNWRASTNLNGSPGVDDPGR